MKNVIVILNNRSLQYYDFYELKKSYNLRISAIIFNKSFKKLSMAQREILDNIHVLQDITSPHGILEFFPKDAIDSIVREEIKNFPNTWIIAADELNNLMVSSLREKYMLPGTPYSIILNFRNKSIQKEVLKTQKIQIPKFKTLHRKYLKNNMSTNYKSLTNILGVPFVIKPLDMSATIGVEKIETYDQFLNYFSKNSIFSSFIAEEFITGKFYHCDFIIQDDTYVFSEVSEYLSNGLSFISGCNHGSLMLLSDNPLRSKIIDFCKKVNYFLGLKSGCGHFEIFVTEEHKLIFLEAAARPAGSIVPLVFTKTFKKNYMNAALLAEIEENPGTFQSPSEYYFWACFPKRTGLIKKLRIPSLKSSYQIEWYVKLGDFLERSSLSLVERAGIILVGNKNYEILKFDFDSIIFFEALETE